MKCYVYFIRQSKKGPIKIGYAKDPQKRLESLQIGNPQKLSLIAKIECDCDKEARHVEQKLHRLFKKQSIRGEWFYGSIKIKNVDGLIMKEKRYYETFRRKAAAIEYAFTRELLYQEQIEEYAAGNDIILTDEQWGLLEVGGHRRGLCT